MSRIRLGLVSGAKKIRPRWTRLKSSYCKSSRSSSAGSLGKQYAVGRIDVSQASCVFMGGWKVQTSFPVTMITPAIFNWIVAYAVRQGLGGGTVIRSKPGDTEQCRHSVKPACNVVPTTRVRVRNIHVVVVGSRFLELVKRQRRITMNGRRSNRERTCTSALTGSWVDDRFVG